jgi:hypothetical protein
MVETFFGFKKTPFCDSPDPKQLFSSQAWNQAKARLQFLADHHGAGLLTGEVGSGKSTAARSFTAALNPNLYKVLYLHWTPGSTLDLLRQLALELDLEPAHYRGDLVRQISQTIVRLNQSKKQHPILICDEAQLPANSRTCHPHFCQFALDLMMDTRCRMSLRARDISFRQQDGIDERNCGRQISMPPQRHFPFRRKGVVKRIPHQPPMDLKHLCNSPDASHSPPVFTSYLCIQIYLAFHIHLDSPVCSVNSGASACSSAWANSAGEL